MVLLFYNKTKSGELGGSLEGSYIHELPSHLSSMRSNA